MNRPQKGGITPRKSLQLSYRVLRIVLQIITWGIYQRGKSWLGPVWFVVSRFDLDLLRPGQLDPN